jgi:hypothetical protein
MRKIFTLLILAFFIHTQAHGQLWLEIGGKGMMGFTGFTNANINSDAQHDASLGLATSVGAVACLNIGDYHGLNFEILSNTHHQSMTYRGNGANQAVNIEWQSTDLYLMYRWYRDNGAFLELGGKSTIINEAQQSLGTDWSEVSDKYQGYYSGAFGIGGFVTANKVLTVKTGIRAEYALTDMVSGEGRAEGFPSPYTSFDNYEETRPFRAGFYIEVTFGVGGIAQSQCGARGVLLGTGYN